MKYLLLTKLALIETSPYVLSMSNADLSRRWRLYHEAVTTYHLIAALCSLAGADAHPRMLRLMKRAGARMNRRLETATGRIA